MTQLQMVILICLGVLLLLCLIVSMTLRHYIGGFLADVAREEEESEEEEARDAESPARQENET